MANPKSSSSAPTGAKGPTPGVQVVPVKIGGESIVDRLIPHIKKIAVTAVLVAIVLGVIFGLRWWKQRGEAKRTILLAQSLDVLRRDVVAPPPPPEAGSGSDAPPTPPADPSAEPTFDSPKERAEAGLRELGAKGIAPLAGPLYRAGLLFDAGRLDEALVEYARAAKTPGLDGALGREGTGLTLEAKANEAKDAAGKEQLLNQALAAFREVQPDAKGPRRDYALYHEARLLDVMNKHAEAIAAFEKFLVEQPTSSLRDTVESRLAKLEAGA